MDNQSQDETNVTPENTLDLGPKTAETEETAASVAVVSAADWVYCAYCDAEIELSPEERAQGWFTCPECGELTHLAEPPSEDVAAEPKLALTDELVDWVAVDLVSGTEQAALVVGYLQANDIEARTWQELGISFGELGPSHIMVHESDAESARTLLEMAREEVLDSADQGEEELSDLAKTSMGVAAIAFNPIGAGIAYVLARVLGDEDEQANLVECGNCQTLLELSEEEVVRGWFACPECGHTNFLTNEVRCPACQTELVLDETELAQGWYQCPECGQVTKLAAGKA